MLQFLYLPMETFERESTPRESLEQIRRRTNAILNDFDSFALMATEGEPATTTSDADLLKELYTTTIIDQESGDIISTTNHLEVLHTIVEQIDEKLNEFVPDSNWRALHMMTGVSNRAINCWLDDLKNAATNNDLVSTASVEKLASAVKSIIEEIITAVLRLSAEPELNLDNPNQP